MNLIIRKAYIQNDVTIQYLGAVMLQLVPHNCPLNHSWHLRLVPQTVCRTEDGPPYQLWCRGWSPYDSALLALLLIEPYIHKRIKSS